MPSIEDYRKKKEKKRKKKIKRKRKKDGKEENKDCCHLLQTLRPSPPATTETQQTPKPQQKLLNCVETPIPESLLRQGVPIKMWVAAEKLKEKNFREEQKGRIKIRMKKKVQTSASPFPRKKCWGSPSTPSYRDMQKPPYPQVDFHKHAADTMLAKLICSQSDLPFLLSTTNRVSNLCLKIPSAGMGQTICEN